VCSTCQVLDPGEEVAVESRGVEVGADGVRELVALRLLGAGAGDGAMLGADRTRFLCTKPARNRASVHRSGEHAAAPLRVVWAGVQGGVPELGLFLGALHFGGGPVVALLGMRWQPAASARPPCAHCQVLRLLPATGASVPVTRAPGTCDTPAWRACLIP